MSAAHGGGGPTEVVDTFIKVDGVPCKGFEYPKWEAVPNTKATQRLEVPGGWLYRDRLLYCEPTMCFVPNTNY